MDRKSQTGSPSNDDQATKVDLTLRLGVPGYDNQTPEENRSVARVDRAPQGNIVEAGGSSSAHRTNEAGGMAYAQDPANFAFYQGFVPQNRAAGRRRHNTDDEKVCRECGVVNTPLWRKGPHGPQTLCNACGLRHARTTKRSAD
ncbi:Cutinasepalindrome-binding protein [Sesamum alatum]|uniref:Cutinasepalindrome-binding protein n=1 Tax=Sesamum alatum TaxID=300844 RepID=A0AAE1XWP4_9LAMI|nr:Cutinasepalindrome-binding protein [Sesamum alatum]